MQQQTLELRTRLRVVNIEHSRLLKEKTSQGWFARMGELKSERRALMAQLAGSRSSPEVASAGSHARPEAANQNTPG
jgi:hypothetical protein